MVFRFADYDFVTRLQTRTGIALGNQIDRFRGAFRPDNGARILRMQKGRHLFPRMLKTLRQRTRRLMLTAVNRRVFGTVKLLYGINDGLWFQGGGRAVQIDGGIPERGELLAKHCGVKRCHDRPLLASQILSHFAGGNKFKTILNTTLWKSGESLLSFKMLSFSISLCI